RKFIDLINEATFKWANLDPSKTITIGDFGTIDKKTGELKTEGNIFTHPEIRQFTQAYPSFEAPEVDLYQIHSREVRRLDVQDDDDPSPVPLKSRWQFNNKRGAILLMHRPRLLCVPDGFFDEKVDLPILKRKVVVEQVYNCPGFFMYLSNKVSLRLDTGANAGSGQTLASTGWSADGATGIYQQAFREDAVYTPLFRVKSLGRRHWRR
ncbi:hypothetical protein V8E53_006953, partial [Lactarius tabidus]